MTSGRRSESYAKKTERQVVKPADPGQEEIAESVPKVEVQVPGPLDDFLGRAQKAYLTYLDAQKDVWKAYHEAEQKVDDDYREAEQKANAVRDETIEQTMALRAKAEQEADQAYLKAVEQAQKEYARAREEAKNTAEANIRKAIADHKQTLEQSRAARAQAVQRAQKIFA